MPGFITSTVQKFVYPFLAKDPDARILQLAGIGRFALIFIQGIVHVKSGVPLEIIGKIEFVFFVANFLVFYFQNGGRNALLSWVPGRSDSGDLHDKLSAVYAALHVFGAVAALVLLIGSQFFHTGKYEWLLHDSSVIYLAVYVLFTTPVTALIYNYLLTGRRHRILWFITVSYIIQILTVIVPVVTGAGVDTMLAALAVFAVARWLFATADGGWFRNGFPAVARITAFIGFALPLVLHALNSGLMDYVDGWVVSAYFGDEQFALYRYGAKEFPVNALLIGGLLTGMIPRFRADGQVKADALKREIARLMRVLIPANCLLILLSPMLYELVYSEEFVTSARIFNIYALTLLSRVVMNQVFLYVFHHNWVLAGSTMVEVVINVALSIVLMQEYGLIGIPAATVIAYALHKIFIIAYIRRYFKSPFGSYIPLLPYVVSVIAMVACVVAAELIYY